MAQASVPGQLAGVPTAGQVGVDGLWARLRRGVKRVVLALVDSQSGVVWPPVVVSGEEKWEQLFARANEAGLDLDELRGLVSDGASGLLGYLDRVLVWVNHQRCILHLWRNLSGELAARVNEAGQGLAGAAVLAGHRRGARLARAVAEHLEEALVHLGTYNRGLERVGPEWLWRDFRLGLGRGRNHATDERLERAPLVWAIYRNFTPAQRRSERKRHYRRPGKSPLEMAGVPPGEPSYLDALGV
ncbi:MAG: transposase [Chloroflexota bacterium]